MYKSSDVTDPSHISPMVWGRDHTAAILVSSGPTVGGLPPNDGASTLSYRCTQYSCVDEQMTNTPNKRMDMASIHSYETVCASIAMDGGD